MWTFIRNILMLVLFLCVAFVMLYIGIAVVAVVLVVGLIAAAWYGWKFYFIRRELERTVREHQQARPASQQRRQQRPDEGEVIDAEYYEVDKDQKR